ncbi:MAG: peptidase family protein [Ilumatobacteraceae bacterium]|nr:peptidase family protein [Ilumatobacteraceae bacterium]
MSHRGWGAAVCVAVLGLGVAGCASTDPGLTDATAMSPTTAAATSTAATSTGDTATTTPADTSAADTSPADSSTADSSTPDTSTGATGPIGSSGVSGVGDVLFPDLGNPGIDVQHYDVDITYDHATAEIDGNVVLTITATADLAGFTLDEVGLHVTAVEVDDAAVTYAADDPELRITPAAPIPKGSSFTVAVAYSTHGNPASVSAGVTAGWFETQDGSFVLDEPDGARNWLPSNDHPSDKASYHFTIHVPTGITAAANGTLVSHDSTAAGDVWVWDETQPMTTYVIQLLTGHLEIVTGTSPSGVALTSVLQAGDDALMQPFLDSTGKQVDYFAGIFGPYPFSSYGVAMTDGFIGGAMEEQTRSLFSRDDFAGGTLDQETELLLSHELTHQWFGDGVSPQRWQDIWLNESFATYGQWLWLDHEGYRTVTDYADEALAERQRNGGDAPSDATGTPDVPGLFGYDVYEGGAVVLQALRDEVGDTAFFQILKTWVQSNLGTSRSSKEFVALSSKIAGRDLTSFFDTWLYAPRVPATYPS